MQKAFANKSFRKTYKDLSSQSQDKEGFLMKQDTKRTTKENTDKHNHIQI